MRRFTRDNPVDSGHKAFDAIANHPNKGLLSVGNVSSPIQASYYIRPFNETLCNGQKFAPGALRAFDLKAFGVIPDGILRAVEQHTQSEQVILYKFRHRSKGREVVHGWLVTADQGGMHEMIAVQYGPHPKSRLVVDVCKRYVSNPPGSKRRFHDEVVPAQIRHLSDLLSAEPAAVRAAAEDILALVGSDPDVGVDTERYSGHYEHANIVRAVADPVGMRFAAFSVAGQEVLAKARAVADALPEGDQRRLRSALSACYAFADHEQHFGMADFGVTLRELARHVAAARGPGAPAPR